MATPLPRQKEEEGLKAYEQVRAFEAVRRRLPWIYSIFYLLVVIVGLALLQAHRESLALALGTGMICLAVWSWLDWRKQKARYARNLALLATLEEAYGDALPWMQVENHFRELDRLKEELAREKIGEALRDVRQDWEDRSGEGR